MRKTVWAQKDSQKRRPSRKVSVTSVMCTPMYTIGCVGKVGMHQAQIKVCESEINIVVQTQLGILNRELRASRLQCC